VRRKTAHDERRKYYRKPGQHPRHSTGFLLFPSSFFLLPSSFFLVPSSFAHSAFC
jgi:hypothetical protein